MSRFDPSQVALHLNVAVLACDSSATLEETLKLLKGLPLHIKRVGAAAIAFPASEFDAVRAALHADATFPRVVGGAPDTAGPKEQDEA